MTTFPAPHIDRPHEWDGRTVGLLGGSFNPAHAGHKHISEYALKLLGIDAVWWIVSPQNPLKSTKGMAPYEERMNSANTAKQNEKIIVTDIEKQMGTRYTINTLNGLKTHFPNTRFIWLMGRDNLNQIHKWDHWEDIFKTMPICVMDRPPQGDDCLNDMPPAAVQFKDVKISEDLAIGLKNKTAPAWTLLHIPLNHLSSTEIRNGQKKD